MTERTAEVTEIHTRTLRCTLEIEDSRAYWQHVDPDDTEHRARRAFENFWFGARSLSRVKLLINTFRSRFDRYPQALAVLRHWTPMDPDCRKLVCHWHLQLSDPLYREMTGDLLPQRRQHGQQHVTRDAVHTWVAARTGDRWTVVTQLQCASKLLSAAHSAGLVLTNRDPRPLSFPRVTDSALSYILYLLRTVDHQGSLLDNPYLRSVGLDGSAVESRLRSLNSITFRRQGDLTDIAWQYITLWDWARQTVCKDALQQGEAA